MSKRDGDPAFPRSYSEQQPGDRVECMYAQDGMSLRDWLAGQALAIIADHPSWDAMQADGGKTIAAHIAHVCYLLADAMLEQRKKD